MSSAAGVPTVAAAPDAQSSSPAVDLQTIAHELRQPLSAIESIAYYFSLALPRDSWPARKQAKRLQQLVEQSNWILTCALQLADEAPLAPQPQNLEELIIQTVNARTAHGDPRIHLELAGGLPLVNLDPGRGRTLLENLLTLFRQLATDLHPVRVTTTAGDGGSVSRHSHHDTGLPFGGFARARMRSEHPERASSRRGAWRNLQHPGGRCKWGESQGGATMKFPLHGSGSPFCARTSPSTNFTSSKPPRMAPTRFC
jgi:hypothetical protein